MAMLLPASCRKPARAGFFTSAFSKPNHGRVTRSRRKVKAKLSAKRLMRRAQCATRATPRHAVGVELLARRRELAEHDRDYRTCGWPPSFLSILHEHANPGERDNLRRGRARGGRRQQLCRPLRIDRPAAARPL